MANQLNTENDSLAESLTKMSLSSPAAIALPPSSPAGTAATESNQSVGASPTTPRRPSNTPLRRPPSFNSLAGNDNNARSPIQRKTSATSLKGASTATPPRSPALRRSSSYFHNLSMGDRSSLPPPLEEALPKIPLTAASIAQEFFRKELQAGSASDSVSPEVQTIVILQDACYGHRYSRPRTSKASLGTIVERPERIHASILGVSTAYVRLGSRHAGGEVEPHPREDPSRFPPPFKIHKTSRTLSLTSPAATAIHGARWMEELSHMCSQAEFKLAMNGKELVRSKSTTGTNDGIAADKPAFHEGDLYLCSKSLAALEGALGGVCEAVDAVFGTAMVKRAFVCIRPPGHHCAADMPSGFCWLNNVHVGIGHASITHGLTHAAIIDFDLHHGDGSQSITWDHNARIANLPKNTPVSKKTSIGYFSLHDINSYPCEMGDEEKVRSASLCIENAHGQSIWNVHLQPWKTVAEFWALYEDRYLVVLAKARAFLRAHSDRLRQAPTHPKPKGAIFISAGFDASEWESPGMQRHQVNVPTEFYARFTRDVVAMAEDETLGVDGRVISVLEGGYSDRALMSGVFSHICGMTAPYPSGTSRPSTSGSASSQLQSPNGSLNRTSGWSMSNTLKQSCQTYDPAWWSLSNLEELENLVDPALPPVVPKGQRGKVQPTFTTPTESFIAKVIEPAKARRSFSGVPVTYSSPPVGQRETSPPPPKVDWATAAHELCRLLVPSDQETRSCRPEELNAEATRKRRDRMSNIGLPAEEATTASEPKTMQLREKKLKAPANHGPAEEARKPVSRASRRKTVADVSLLASEGESLPSSTGQEIPPLARTARRRSSVASSTTSTSGLNVDKTQHGALATKSSTPPVGPTRGDAVKPKVVRRSGVAPRAPSAGNVAARQAASAASNLVMAKAPLSSNDDAKNRDVDQLAAGMKNISIKLNVPPKEEYEARQAKPKAAPKGRPPKNAVSKMSKAKSPVKPKGKTLADPTSKTAPKSNADVSQGPMTPAFVSPSSATWEMPVQPESEPAGPQTRIGERNGMPLAAVTSSSIQPTTTQPESDTMAAEQVAPPRIPDASVADTKVGVPSPASVPLPNSSPPLHAPSTPVTAQRRIKGGLPVFTATSPIAFGQPKASGLDQVMKTANGAPPQMNFEPPSHFAKPSNNAAPDSASQDTGPMSQAASSYTPQVGTKAPQTRPPDRSIWDIPDTPQPR